MNTIPLVKGNTQEEINTSLIALKKALSELEAQDRLLQGTDKDVQDKIKQINELIEGINTHLGTVDTHLTTIDGQITALQPVDTVTSGNMHSVTSNAVAGAIDNYRGNIGTWFTSSMKNEIISSFNNASNYSLFSGQTSNDAECGWYGFKHNPTRGGCCIIMNERYGCFFCHGVGDPSTWNYNCIIKSF